VCAGLIVWSAAIFVKLIDRQIIHPNHYRQTPTSQNAKPTTPPISTRIPAPGPNDPNLASGHHLSSENLLRSSSLYNRTIEWVRREPGFATPVIAVLGALLASLCNVLLWPGLRSFIGYCRDRGMAIMSGRRCEIAYLDSTIRLNRFLPLLPTTLVPVTSNGAHQELDSIYISLSVADRDGSGNTDLADALQKFNRLVILGDPGSGKTTTLRFLTLACARARRGRPHSRQPEDRRRERDQIRTARNHILNEFRFSKCPLPVFVFLNRWRDISKWPPTKSLLDCVREEWRA
jgi:hypothetical protein